MISLKLIKSFKAKKIISICSSFQFNTSTNSQGSTSKIYRPKQAIDPENVIDQKVNILTQMILSSKHPIFFTGAGISTSLGIPDYRSGEGTIIQTGPGLWNRPMKEVKAIQQTRNILIDQLIPSITHMTIQTLIDQKVFKHVVSQNTDGLHLRSGIKKCSLSQLHGNRNLEFCTKCSRKYLRDFRTLKKTDKDLKPGEKRCHITKRKCENCSGDLHDSIVYFGEKLPKEELVKSYQEGAKSDLCVAIGSSLTVKPSANVPLLPLKYNQSGKLAIINIQQTPLDQYATLKINSFCDIVMTKLMEKLNIPIAEFKVERYLEITVQKQYNGWLVKVNGVDVQHYNFSYIRNVQVMVAHSGQQQVEEQENTTISELRNMFDFTLSADDHQSLDQVNLKVKFFGPFPDLQLNLSHVFQSKDIIGHQSKIIRLTSTNNGSWTVHKAN